MSKWIWFSVAVVFGGFARYLLGTAVYRKFGGGFPTGTLLVNLSGCLLIGFFNSLAQDKLLLGPEERLWLMTGFCGAYTTFSTFILETSNLFRDGESSWALLNIALSLLLGLAVFRVGTWLARAV